MRFLGKYTQSCYPFSILTSGVLFLVDMRLKETYKGKADYSQNARQNVLYTIPGELVNTTLKAIET